MPLMDLPMARYSTNNKDASTWKGNELSSSKEANTTRIQFHNVNGLPLQGTEGLDIFINDQIISDVDILAISEHCLDTTKFQVYQTTQETLRKTYNGQSMILLHSSQEPATNAYKPGGTGLLVLGDMVSKLEPQGRGGDPMGRWTYMHFRRRDQHPVTVISAYQVCPRPTNLIGNTAYHQQVRALSMKGINNMHPRQAFIRDLESFITLLQSKGHDIILGGDFNEALEDRNSGILRLITTTNLTDPFLHKFPHHPPFGTHVMGSRRIDSVYISPNLMQSVKSIGYAPFDYTRNSDHRALVVDFDTQVLMGHRTSPLQSATNRILKSKDKVMVERFISNWFDELTKANVFAQQQQLDNNDASPQILEMVDNLIGTTGDEAEKACRRRRPEFFSQKLVQTRIKVSILRRHLRSIRMGVDRRPQLTARMLRAGLDFPLPSTIRTANQALRQASNDLQKSRREHAEIRQAELEEKIEDATARGNKTKAKVLRAIKKVEGNQRTYKILQQMKQRTSEAPQIDRVEIPASWPSLHEPVHEVGNLEDPKTCTNWKLITDPREVEYYLMLRNRIHFGQAEGTPFTQPPLSDDLNWTAETDAAEELLQGSYLQTVVIPECSYILQAFRTPTTLDSLPSGINIDEFQNKIKVWRESTTTSPSGRHLGRYKSLFTKVPTVTSEDSPHDLTLEDKQKAIASLIVSVLNYCIRNTYVPNRWKTVINVMIFKEQGDYRIHRLRVIHIYEADFNLLLAVKWRQLLHTSDALGLIHEGQYGGRPGCEAQSLTLLEELKYDLSYLTRRTLFNFDNDASSCYDRILVPFASIVNRRYGLHRKVVAIHAKTLQQAKYYLKTATGISEIYYSTCSQYPIHGTGQGSANSPCIWLFISSTLFAVHNQYANGATFVSPDGTVKVSFSMVGFVDDATGTYNDFQPQTERNIQDMLQQMTHDAQLWSNLLYCSGGKLELSKCSFHVLKFEFRPNGTPIPSIGLYNDSVRIKDLETQETISIQSKRAFNPHKTLGHYKSPASKPTAELQNLVTKANRLAVLITNSPITRHGALLAYHTVYIPSIRYTLPQSFFSRPDLERSQAPSLHRILGKCGYNRNTARDIIFAPINYAGAGFIPWHLLQGEGQILHFLKHWRTHTLISSTLRVTTMWAQWQSGHHTSILEDPFTLIPYLECRWISSLRSFLKDINATIQVDIPLAAAPERSTDMFIMQYASDCGLFDSDDLTIINYCRLYLHVTTVSELFNAQGTNILPELFNCHREPWFDPATYVTLQRRPSDYQIRTKWQRLCRQWAKEDGVLGASFSLGKWTVPGNQLRRRRQTYLDTTHPRKLYHWYNTGYWEYTQDPYIRMLYRPVQETTWRPTSISCIPVDVILNTDGTVTRPTKMTPFAPRQRALRVPTNFTQYIDSLSKWEQFLIVGVNLLHQPHDILHQINQLPEHVKLLAVSDGSKKGQHISYGWVFGSDESQIFAEHSGLGLGTPTSHRAEGWGMLSVAVFVHHLYQYTNALATYGIPKTALEFISDNNGLIQRITQRRQYSVPYPNTTLASDWDIVEQIVQTLDQLPHTNLHAQWIKGHQDTMGHQLSVEAHYNIRADALAALVPPTSSPLRIALPAAKCTLAIGSREITGHYCQEVREAYTLPRYQTYLARRYGWTPQQCSSVDWEVLSQSVCTQQKNHIQIVKLIHGKLPTNSELAKTTPHQSDKCHYCDARETFAHLIRCSNPLSSAFRLKLVDAVEDYMTQRELPEPMCYAMKIGLTLSLQNPPAQSGSQAEEVPSEVIEQLNLGPNSMMQGFLIQSWRMRYLEELSQPGLDHTKSPEVILAGIVKIIWTTQLQLWEDHLIAQTQSSNGTTSHAQEKIIQYQTRIRILHAKKDQCLPGHRDKFFYSNLEEYLNTATANQMKQYLHHYEPVILKSIQSAKNQPLRSLLSFPGFLRRPQPLVAPRPDSDTAQTSTSQHSSQQSHDQRGALSFHHKHTRWRTRPSIVPTIKSFFLSKPT